MHNLESVQENEMHKILFEIQTDHLISARRPDLVIVNKEKKENPPKSRLSLPADHSVKPT